MVSVAPDVFPHNKQAASAAILDNFNNFMLPHEIRLSECSLGTALEQILAVVQFRKTYRGGILRVRALA